MQYAFFFLSGIVMIGLVANFFIGESTTSSGLGNSVILEQQIIAALKSSADIKPHRGSGR